VPYHVESTNTGSEETLSLAVSWIYECDNGHLTCSHLTLEGHQLPTRLIDVGTSAGSMKHHLWINSQSTVSVAYVAISYRWSPAPAILLTQDTQASFMEEIPISKLPKANQDAIEVTRRLNIRYLWIDALCIIQDLESDWQIESQKMAKSINLLIAPYKRHRLQWEEGCSSWIDIRSRRNSDRTRQKRTPRRKCCSIMIFDSSAKMGYLMP